MQRRHTPNESRVTSHEVLPLPVQILFFVTVIRLVKMFGILGPLLLILPLTPAPALLLAAACCCLLMLLLMMMMMTTTTTTTTIAGQEKFETRQIISPISH